MNAAAVRLGLHAGLLLADARARLPDLLATEAEPEADAALLEMVADWCDRFTPLVALAPPDAVVLDVTGAVHLFGGEERLLGRLRRAFARSGIAARLSVAASPSMARAMARFGAEGALASQHERAALRALTIHALELPQDLSRLLLRLGLKTLGRVDDQPRHALTARFGATLLDRLDAVLGRREEAFASRRPLPACMAERRFAEPVTAEPAILETIGQLTQDLAAVLEGRGEGGRRFEASFFRADGAVRRLAVETGRPVRDSRTVERLFRERLASLADPLDPGFGYDLVRLAVARTEDWDEGAPRLDGGGAAEAALDALVDRLGVRLGAERVTRLLPLDSHIPERAARRRPAGLSEAAVRSWPTERPLGEPPIRPLRLFEPPERIEIIIHLMPDGPPARFRWRRAEHAVARIEGPERIAPEWWRAEPTAATRDYFRIEDRDGHRFWLFRQWADAPDGSKSYWFLHGLFG